MARKKQNKATVNTDGGAYVGGNVNTGGGEFIGRDKYTATHGAQQINAPVNGDVLGPGAKKIEQHFHETEKPDPSALENTYLTALMSQVGQLSLEGIDPQAASEAEKRLSLGAVYTALLTLSSEAYDELTRDKKALRQARRRSVLAELDKHSHLVLLGDPGSGKSTFVNFLSLCLAGERLGHDQLNLRALTAPLPDDENEPQPWRHGALLPVRVILRDFAARGLPPARQPVTVEHFWRFLADELDTLGCREYAPVLRQKLQKEGGLLLFDGLDEVPQAEERREKIIQLVSQVKTAFPRCRILVTSRLYAYRQQDWALDGFTATVLAPFSRGQIIRFVERWYAHIAQLRSMNPQDAQGRAALLKRAIFSSDRLQALAERPLLLTLMASLHAWRGGTLPERREQLYSDTVDLLLDWWERRRVVREANGEIRLIQPSLAEFLKVDRSALRKALNELAFEVHASQPDLQGTADIAEKDLVYRLFQISGEQVSERVLLEYLRDRAGLLIPRGVGVYTFPHRTFQEYLAACHLTDDEYPDKVAELARAEPNRWREALLLAGAKAARGAASTIWTLAETLCLQDPPADGPLPKADLWGAYLAGQALAESVDLQRIRERDRPKVERVQRWLIAILDRNAFPTQERARAGNVLAALGDPRFDPQQWYLPVLFHGKPEPALGFVRIPAGEFWMGSADNDSGAYNDEKPRHKLHLPEFWIARYPVTVAQWRAFVEATGYDRFDQRALRDPDNHPVCYVTWYEALAYCRWLDEQLKARSSQAAGVSGQGEEAALFWQAVASGQYHVTLPSEAEWEKAARFPLTLSPRPDGHPPSSLPAGEGKGGRGEGVRVYPWGDEITPDHANYDETSLGTTSPVGAFPKWESPYGVLDMSGNVWQWTRSRYRNYPYDPDDGRENLDSADLRVLRGGSWSDDRRLARAAVRNRDHPDDFFNNIGFRMVLSLAERTK